MGWECPLCNSINHDDLLRCTCGYTFTDEKQETHGVKEPRKDQSVSDSAANPLREITVEQIRKLSFKSKMLSAAGWIALFYAFVCLVIVIFNIGKFGDVAMLAALRIPFAIACFYGFVYRSAIGRIVGNIGFIIIGIAVLPLFINFIYLIVFASSVFGAHLLYGQNKITAELLDSELKKGTN